MWSSALLGAWIAVAVSGPAPSSEERDELLRACSEAIAGRCSLTGDGDSDKAPDALAVITLDAGVTSASVELGRTGSAWKKRTLSFADADSPKERWRALGLTLATLFGDPSRAEPEAKVTPAETRPKEVADRGPEEPERRDEITAPRVPFARLGAALTTSPALTQGPLRFGALLRGSVSPFGGRIEPMLEAGYGFRPGTSRDLSLRFVTLSGGIALPYTLADAFTLRLRLEAAGEWVLVSQSNPPDSGGRFVPGGLLGLDATWPARSPLAGFVGADLWLLTGATAVRAGSEKVASVPARRWSAIAGILLSLD